MSDNEIIKDEGLKEEDKGVTRRGFLSTALAGTVVGAGLAMGLKPGESLAAEQAGGLSSHVPPGKLDDYYGFWSGGQSGEIRIMGVPSMRELKRVPVFNYEGATGHGATDRTKKMMGRFMNGDTHHLHLSYDNGTYDGRYAYINDKLNSRIGRIRLDYLETDAITELPNSQGFHGLFPMRVRRKGKPYLVFCNSEFRTPLPNDGRDLEDSKKYGALHTAVDGDTMQVRWQVRVSGNMDNCGTDYKGLYSMATCYDSEDAVDLAGFMENDMDWVVVFNINAIEEAIAKKDFTTIGKSKVPVIEGRKGTKGEGKYTLYVPVPKNPHGINIDPTGRYAIAMGKLSPTTTVIDIDKIAPAFEGKIKPRDCVVAEPELGLGPLHTAFDGRGNAYTSLFLDSQMVKWNIDKAIRQYKGEKVNPIIDKIDVHYQVGHTNASMSETKEADGKWLIALCKFSKDRFLPVGPRHPDNDQLIDISGDKMRLEHDGPVHPEPHDAVIVRKDIIKPKKVYDPKDKMFDEYHKMAKEDGGEIGKLGGAFRKGKKVRVYITGTAPSYTPAEFKVKKGDTVQLIVTNNDDIEDLTHGFAIANYGVNFAVDPGQTESVTFVADRPGVYWYYCTSFCHALHLEMRGRMIVEV